MFVPGRKAVLVLDRQNALIVRASATALRRPPPLIPGDFSVDNQFALCYVRYTNLCSLYVPYNPRWSRSMSERTSNTEFVQSLERGLAVIQAFGPDHQEMTISEVAAATGTTRATARRFLLTLEQLGHVRNDGRNFSLTPRVLGLGYAYLSSLNWWKIAQNAMEEVVQELQESCSASVLDGKDVIYVARVSATRIMSINLSIGTRLPAHVTSLGRVLLSHQPPEALDQYLAEITPHKFTEWTKTEPQELREAIETARMKGYALVDQELETGLRSLAVPNYDHSGRILAALNAGTHAARTRLDEMTGRFLPVLHEASRKITAQMAN
jgi:IclR family pca regulon transcriptional regulator